MDELQRALREHFGFEQFRPGQREVIEHLLAREHTLAVMPTGLGKSLCYQLTSQMLPGLTLVVSPLIALMQDQVGGLLKRGFDNVTALSSAVSPAEIGQRYAEIENGRHKLVYVAPERCDSPRFQQLVRQSAVSLVVIDEAHCISQWGHDFRPHYRTLLARLPELRRATFLALTATATPDVQDDIAAALGLPDLVRVIADFDRPNLRFETVRVDRREEKEARLVELLGQDDGAAIVYASTRKEAAEVFHLLRDRGFDVCLYHAGLDASERAQSQNRFLSNQCRIIVATVAFGLGIDKPNVRRVIHFNVPGSIENYYQEAGRAGRDGQPATCTLLYWQSDLRIQRFLLEQAYPDPGVIRRVFDQMRDAHPLAVSSGDLARAGNLPEITVNAALQLLYEQQALRLTAEGKYEMALAGAGDLKIEERGLHQRRFRANERLRKMIEYAGDAKCRRAQILGYFGQTFASPCNACDVCDAASRPQPPPALPDAVATEASDRIARAILQTAAELGGRYGRTLVADLLAGSRRQRIVETGLDRSPGYGALRLHSHDRVLGWIDELIARQWLKVTAEEYPRLLLSEAGRAALHEPGLIALSGFAPPELHDSATQTAVVEEPESAKAQNGPRANLAAMNDELVERMKQWRREKAAALNVAPFVILHDSVLARIVERRPRDIAELGEIKGIGSHKLEQLGAEILEILRGMKRADAPADLRLQIEIWRQGGDEPDAQMLFDALAKSHEIEHGDLVVVINAISELGLRQAADALTGLLRETTNGNLLMTLAEGAGRMGISSAEAELIRLLDDERPGVRRAAARGLGRLRAERALERLEIMARSEATASVQLAATAAVWRIRNT
ncbi:MAG: RecQ family ATP-dependent DNA helicase [Blastocatellia bacterium]